MLIQNALIFQQKELSTAAWIALAVIILLVLFINFSLFAALRKKDNTNVHVLQRFVRSIKDPQNPAEDIQKELNERVKHLTENKPPPKE
jgi:hypothetical protein